MKLNHAIKKIAAIGAGAMLLGVSAAAVTAAHDLSDYPVPFIQNGEFAGNIVLGSSAQTIDVLGAVSIATSLQASAVTSSPVDTTGSGTQTVLQDAVRVASGSDNLLYGQNLSNVKSTLTDNDLSMLKTTTFTDTSGTEYDLDFRVGLPNAATTLSDSELSDRNADPTYYVDFGNGETWNLDMSFPTAVNISDLKGQDMTILGQTYTVGQGTETSQANKKLTLYKSGIKKTVEAGSPQTVVVNGKDVSISVIGANSNASPPTATVSVNGEAKTVTEGQFYTIGGVRVYIDDVFVVNIPTEVASVRFFVGAQKIVLEDGKKVSKEVGGSSDPIYGTSVSFSGSSKTSQIRITYTPGDHKSDYSPVVNKDQRALVLGDSYVDPVFQQIKFAFTDVVPGSMASSKELIKLYPAADDELALDANNYNGQEYDLTLFRISGTQAALAYGDRAGEVYKLSGSTVSENNRFIIRKSGGSLTSGSEYSRFIELTDVSNDTNDVSISLSDLANGGDSQDVTTAQTRANNLGGNGTMEPYGQFTYDGVDYGFFVLNATTIQLVQASNGAPTANVSLSNVFVTENGATLQIPTTGFDSNAMLNLTEETDFNDASVSSSQAGTLGFNLTEDSTSTDNKLTVGDVTYNKTWSGKQRLQSNDKIDVGTTVYGTYFELNTDSNGGDVSVYYPRDQVYYNVFVGPESAGTTTSGSEGAATTESVNPINVGAAILDTDAAGLVGSSNLIVVGGPCVNTVAAQLLNNPADCASGFQQGSAMIKLFSNSDDTVSLLVAGMTGKDTLLASRVLANYAEYEGKLIGSQVVVSGTTLNNVDISAPVQTVDNSTSNMTA